MAPGYKYVLLALENTLYPGIFTRGMSSRQWRSVGWIITMPWLWPNLFNKFQERV
jgi:hypothetical protein